MARQVACTVDNRDAQEMYGYLEAPIETLKRRIAELERANQMLHALIPTKHNSSPSVQAA